MSNYYLKHDIDHWKEQRQGSYLVPESFKKSVRLELKWAYIALFNLLLDEAKYDDSNVAYLDVSLETMSHSLSTLTNKVVDQDKIQKYLNELKEADLLEMIESRYYLKRII